MFGANINAKELHEGYTPLMIASSSEQSEMVDALLKNGADVNMKSNIGWTALMLAVDKGYVEIVNALLKNGANVNATENEGWTALMLIAYSDQISNSLKIVNTLLKNGANPNLQTFKKGYTALILAIVKGKKSIVESLLKFKACPNIKDYSHGTTAIFYALMIGDLDIIKLLYTHKAKLKIASNKGKTLLFLAAQEKNPEIFNFLMKNGANYKKEFTADGKYIASCPKPESEGLKDEE
jgi:ankyrin repeat protein